MLEDLSKSELALANYMSNLSDLAWNAAWMDGLEYELWKVINGKKKRYGRLVVDHVMINKLKQLSKAANGWIIFDKNHDEVVISLKDWEEMFKERSL